jgi:hypothetical protein
VGQWKDPRLESERQRALPVEDVWIPTILVQNRRDVSNSLPEMVDVFPDGTVTYRQRLTGTFAASLDLTRFPLDRQTLSIRFVVYGAGPDEVLLIPSTQLPPGLANKLSITDWRIGELKMVAETFSPVPAGPELSTLETSFEAHRLAGYYIVQLLIPLMMIVGMSWIVFWVDPKVVPARMSIAVTSVLTLIAYRFMIGGLVPKLPYLTTMDYLLLGATLLVAGALVVVARGTFLVGRDRVDAAERLNRIARPVFPAGFVLVLVGLALLR